MSSKELFRNFLTKSISELEGQAERFKDLLRNYDEVFRRDSISQAAIRMSINEATITKDEGTILSHIRRGMISKSDLTTRFARSFNSKDLYLPGGIIKELIFKGMIEQVEDSSLGRVRVFFKAIKIEGSESVDHIHPTDSTPSPSFEELAGAYVDKSGRKRKIEEVPFEDIGPAPSVTSTEDFETIAERLKAKHFKGHEEEPSFDDLLNDGSNSYDDNDGVFGISPEEEEEEEEPTPCVACGKIFRGNGPCPDLYCPTNKQDEDA